ncbi:5HT2A-like protein [Mya arenaria]|uniref:5HT2A-like protein n=1 Tax=Mya arenaria TaxID=6604 RepID=A0ABY7G4D2_MYAAR|nr:5HT2A-like protein [Mya arenaria]
MLIMTNDNRGYFPLGAEYCTFWATMDVLMCTASIWHMCTMSMDRFFTLKYPMQYGRNKTKSMVAVKIIFVWIVSITISSPVFIYGIVDQNAVFHNRLCVIAIKEFVIYGSIFAFYVPLCIMILTYMLTIRILWQNQNMMKTMDSKNFRMRRKSAYKENKVCNVTTMLSPPSSESRRESHTDVSSLARTPNAEHALNCVESDFKILELKNVLDEAYASSLCAKIPTMSPDHQVENDQNSHHSSSENIPDLNEDSSNNLTEPCTECTTNRTLNVPTAVNIQSPSSDDDDEYSTLLPSSTEKLSRSFSSRFRSRANTDVSNISYLNTHSSLKIPKTTEKSNLQASVSCANFTNKGTGSDVFDSLGLHQNGLNRDYKSVEWCHHFQEIQAEMDQCLRESRRERKHNVSTLKSSPPLQPLLKDLSNQASTETQDSGIVSCSKKDQLCLGSHEIVDVSESGDSLDDLDTSSENASELLSIKLYPKSVYMYKLDVKNIGSGKKSQDENSVLSHTAAFKRRCYMNDSSCESDKSSEISKNVVRKKSSIKHFIYKCKKKNGFRHFISSKTTSNEKKASKVLGIIFGVFVILWSPFFIANILSVTCVSCMVYLTNELMSAFLWMGYVASLANPIIYTMFNTAFRRAFIKILSCHLCIRGRNPFPRHSYPSQLASVVTNRRQTLTVLLNGNNRSDTHDKNLSNGR